METDKTGYFNFKVRGSYGLVGNDQIGSDRFAYLAIVNLTESPSYTTGYGGSTTSLSGPTYNRFQNNELTWEVGNKLNVGVDLQLFNSLNITVDGFREIRDNIFQQKKIPYRIIWELPVLKSTVISLK